MNLTWLIVKKDFRRLRLPLALWVILMVGRYVVCGQILHVADDNVPAFQMRVGTLGGIHNLLAALEVFLGCLLVAALIHEDPLVGQQVWWVTRPISGSRLLGAKLLGMVLFFWVLPEVVALPWWLYSGFDGRAIAGAALQVGCTQAAVTLLVLAIAVLTSNAARFVAMVLLVTFAWLCFFVTLMARATDVTPAVMGTRFLAAMLLALAMIGLLVVHQFLTRRTGRSWIIFSSGFMLIVVVATLWPWDWSSWIAWRGAEPPALARVTVVPTGEVDFTKVGSNLDPSLVRMGMGFRFTNLPPEYTVNSGEVTGTLRWPDGMERKRTGWIQSYPMVTSWRIMGLKGSAGVSAEEWQNNQQGRGATGMTLIPRSLAAKLREQAPAWAGELKLRAFRGELVVEVPFRVGEKGGRAGHRLQVMGIEHQDSGGLVVNLAESLPIPPGDTLPIFSMPQSKLGPPALYVLSSRDRTKFILLRAYAEKGTFASSVVVVRSTFGLEPKQLENPADPHWLEHAEILKVAYWPAGVLVRGAHSDALHETQFKNGRRIEPATQPAMGN